MNDTEMLNLIEHYRWSIQFVGDGWFIVLHKAGTFAFDKSLRKAIQLAMAKQAGLTLNK